MLSGVVTLLHTCCGAGVLAIPYAFKPFGFILGILMLLWCALCALCGLLMQCRSAERVGHGEASFAVLAKKVHPTLAVAFDGAIAIKCLGVAISYLVVLGDLLPRFVQDVAPSAPHWLHTREFHITLVTLLIAAPLCFQRNLSALRHASYVAVSAVGYLSCLVLVHWLAPSQEIRDSRGEVSIGLPHNEPPILTTLPVFVFAYTCHHNAFTVINEQSDGKFESTRRVATGAIAAAFLLYLLIGGPGYLTFGNKIVGNIVRLYPSALSATIGRGALVILVTLAYPLQCHPARNSVLQIAQWLRGNSEDNYETLMTPDNENQEREAEQIEDPSQKRAFKIVTTLFLMITYTIAMSVSSLAKVLAVVGATGSTSISFILPGIFGYKLLDTPSYRYTGLALAIWGMCVMVLSLYAVFAYDTTH